MSQVRTVGPDPAQRRLIVDARRDDQPLRRRIHEHDVPRLIGPQDWVRDRVDDQVEPLPFVTDLACAMRSVR